MYLVYINIYDVHLLGVYAPMRVELDRIWPNPLPNPFNIHWVGFIIKPALSLLNLNQTNPIVIELSWVRGLYIKLKIIFLWIKHPFFIIRWRIIVRNFEAWMSDLWEIDYENMNKEKNWGIDSWNWES
jgi:hypothetical protein